MVIAAIALGNARSTLYLPAMPAIYNTLHNTKVIMKMSDFADKTAQKAFLLDPMRIEFSKQEVLPRMVKGLDGLVSFDVVWED